VSDNIVTKVLIVYRIVAIGPELQTVRKYILNYACRIQYSDCRASGTFFQILTESHAISKGVLKNYLAFCCRPPDPLARRERRACPKTRI